MCLFAVYMYSVSWLEKFNNFFSAYISGWDWNFKTCPSPTVHYISSGQLITGRELGLSGLLKLTKLIVHCSAKLIKKWNVSETFW